MSTFDHFTSHAPNHNIPKPKKKLLKYIKEFVKKTGEYEDDDRTIKRILYHLQEFDDDSFREYDVRTFEDLGYADPTEGLKYDELFDKNNEIDEKFKQFQEENRVFIPNDLIKDYDKLSMMTDDDIRLNTYIPEVDENDININHENYIFTVNERDRYIQHIIKFKNVAEMRKLLKPILDENKKLNNRDYSRARKLYFENMMKISDLFYTEIDEF